MAKRVLLVDGSDLNRRKVKKLLCKNGCIVHEADSGAKALKVYVEEHPDVVFIDFTLPDIDCVEAANNIRQVDPAAHIVMGLSLHPGNLA